MQIKLDEIDKTIATLLRKNGRRPAQEIAEILGIHRVTVQNRINRMIGNGILRFSTYVDPTLYRYSILTIVAMDVPYKDTKLAINNLTKHSCNNLITITSGPFNVLSTSLFNDINEMSDFIRTVPFQMRYVRNLEIFVLMSEYEHKDIKPMSKLDENIVKYLRNNGRMSASQIGRNIGESAIAVQRRIKKLREDYQIRVIPFIDHARTNWFHMAIVGIRVKPVYVSNIYNQLKKHPEVRKIYHSCGRYNLILAMETNSREQIYKISDEDISELDGMVYFDVYFCDQIVVNPHFFAKSPKN